MPVRSLLLTLSLALSMNLQANLVSQGAQSLLEVISKSSKVETLLEQRQLFQAGTDSLKAISGDFDLMLKAFGIRGSRGTQDKLLKAIKGIKPATDEDKKVLESIVATLKKPVGELSDNELAKAHDELMYMASRYGKKGNVMLVCLDCSADTAITAKGFKYSMVELNDSKSKSALKSLRAQGPNNVSKYIKSEMSNLKYGEYSAVSGSSLMPDQELAFALFLKLGKEGSGDQKSYVKAVERVLGKNKDGSVDFFNSNYNHSLHMFFQQNHEDDYVKLYTGFLNEIADAKEAKGLSSKEAFEQVLKDKTMEKNAKGELVQNPAKVKMANDIMGSCPMFK